VIELPKDAPMAAYQAYIQALEESFGWDGQDMARNCFLMGEEVGELFGAVRRLERGKASKEDVAEELVDVLNYLLAIANRGGIDLESAFREKNTRNQGRSW